MSFIIAIIVLSILKLTFTIGRFIAAKRLKLPVEKFVIGIDWGKPIFAKKFNDIELVIYPLFFGGYLEYNKDFDPEVKCNAGQKAFLTFASLLMMFISFVIIGLIYINFVPSGKYETIIKSAPEKSQFKAGDKILSANGIKIEGKNTLQTILQKNKFNDGIVDKDLVSYYEDQIIKFNSHNIKNGEIPANTDIIMPVQLSEGKITRRLESRTLKLDAEQVALRDSITEDTYRLDEPVQVHDLAMALADDGYDVIFKIQRSDKVLELSPIEPDEFGNIGAQYQVNTIFKPKSEVLKNLKGDKPTKFDKKAFNKNLISIFAMLALISILVLVHEAGHYLAARMFKIKVERFGFGLPFGPILWQKQCGETLIVVHAFLLGGYVSFPDDDKDNTMPKDSPDRFANKPIYQRFVVVSAGVFANILCAIFIVFLTALLWGKLPTDNYETIIKGLSPKDNAAIIHSGLQKDDKILEINGSPVDTVYALQLFAIKSRKFDGQISPLIAEKNLENLLKSNPKFLANELLPEGTVIKLPIAISEEKVTLTEDMMRGYERITDDKFALTPEQQELTKILSNKKVFNTDGNTTLTDIAYALSDNVCPIYMTIERNGKTIQLPAIYPNEKGVIGVELDKQRIFVETKSFKSAITESWNYLYSQTKMLLKGLWQLFSGKVPLENMHGVVAVVKYGGDVIQQDGFFQGLLLTALISLDLAIVNFLPIPALDGGHVMFLLLEKLYGKPLDEETVNNIATAGFMFLILLMVIVLYNDIVALAMHKI